MKRLVECVPNFSEGRDLSKVDAIVAAMREIPGVYLLDRESDSDHNRSVVTLAGEPEAVAEAALRGVGKAAELIDLAKHSGAHPRMGATDVVPFIPIEGVTIEDCVALAKKVGREIWDRFRIPVYFYEAAAQRPDRANLENIRFVTQTTIDGKPRPFCPATDMPALAAHAKAIGQVDLLEIDPVVAAIGARNC